jgi:hypothetical protein
MGNMPSWLGAQFGSTGTTKQQMGKGKGKVVVVHVL